MATVHCAMSLTEPDAAVAALQMLNREFPHDPDVLYVTIHAYSDLATRASQQLATIAPNSYQAEQLDAESLEMQGKWDEAEAEYRKILQQNPQVAWYSLSHRTNHTFSAANPHDFRDAKKSSMPNCKSIPSNAGAEYVLGELARQAQQWDEAIAHFSRATGTRLWICRGFSGIGMSFNSAQKYLRCHPPLEKYVKMRPKDPAGHYQLAIAYARSGRKEEASREMAIQRDLDEKARQAQRGQDPNSPQ